MEKQKEYVQQFMKEFGCEIIKSYEDPETSGRKIRYYKRKGLMSLLKDAEQDKFDDVVIASYDRISRNPIDHIILRERLKDKRVIIASTKTFYTPTKSDDFIMNLVLDGLSKFEADNTAQRTKDVAKALVKLGKWTGGKTPLGYSYDPQKKQFSIRSDEAEVVRDIFNKYKQKKGFAAIANELEHEGKLKDEKGNSLKWTKHRIKDVMTNPIYTGKFSTLRRKENSGYSLHRKEEWVVIKADKNYNLQPIITQELWDECWDLYQEKLSKQKGKINKYYPATYYLKGIISCGNCDQILASKDFRSKRRGKLYGARMYHCTVCLKCKKQECSCEKKEKCKVKIQCDTVDKLLSELWYEFITETNNFNDIEQKIMENIKLEFDQTVQKYKEKETMIAHLNGKITKLKEEKSKLVQRFEYPILNEDDTSLEEPFESEEVQFIHALELAIIQFEEDLQVQEEDLINLKYEQRHLYNVKEEKNLLHTYILKKKACTFEDLDNYEKREFATSLIQGFVVESNSIKIKMVARPEKTRYIL